MKLSVKSDYAARAVLALARQHHTGAAVRVEQIAAEMAIPPKYLVQILIELKAQHIVRSLRGKQGGYVLARTPAEVSLGDVLRCVHGAVFDTPALEDQNCPSELRSAWQQIQAATCAAADALNFQQFLDAGADKEKMYYI